MEDYDYNQKKSLGISIGKLKRLEELMAIYGPLNEYGYPDRVTSKSVSYYTKEVETRKKAIENISSYIENQFQECDLDKLRKERTSILQSVSDIIEKARRISEEAKKRAKKEEKSLSLTEEEKNMVMVYAIKKQEENYYVNSDEEESYSDEEFFSAEELLIAYDGEGPRSLSKRLGTKINIVK